MFALKYVYESPCGETINFRRNGRYQSGVTKITMALLSAVLPSLKPLKYQLVSLKDPDLTMNIVRPNVQTCMLADRGFNSDTVTCVHVTQLLSEARATKISISDGREELSRTNSTAKCFIISTDNFNNEA